MRFFVKLALLLVILALPVSAAYKLSASSLDADYVPSNVGIIGLRYIHKQGSLSEVVQVYPNTPAEAAGLVPGDRIVAVDGLDIRRYDANQVYELISGLPGQAVALTMMRCDSACRSFPVRLVRIDMNAIASDSIFKIYRYGL